MGALTRRLPRLQHQRTDGEIRHVLMSMTSKWIHAASGGETPFTGSSPQNEAKSADKWNGEMMRHLGNPLRMPRAARIAFKAS